MNIGALTKILAALGTLGLAAMMAVSLFGRVATLPARGAVATNAPPPVPVPLLVQTPPLSPPALRVLQLAQAKVGEGPILAFIKGSREDYHLDAPAIIFLRSQGVSDAVLTAMLTPPPTLAATNPPPVAVVAAAPRSPSPQPQTSDTTVVVVPQETYIETPPADPTVVYYQTFYQNYGYYPPAFYSVNVYGYNHGVYNGNHGGNHDGGIYIGSSPGYHGTYGGGFSGNHTVVPHH